METLTKTKTNFKPIFLYKDEERINKSMEQYKEWLTYLQSGLNTCEKLFEETLTDEERKQILSNGWKGVEQLIRSKSQFPKAKIETLLELQGKDGTDAKESCNFMASRYTAIQATVENGNVIMPDEVISALENEYTYYTKTEKENEAYKIAEVISEQVEKAIALDILKELDRQDVVKGLFKIIDQSFDNGKRSLVPAVTRIGKIDTKYS